ncbi:uncharacterized protein N7518_006683 [Penicillium psychrosexuale]|uniref:uncharacterized protein n=1 Tax=Penicillium psychrosexuale TaxID=1002107 RepID=UPI002545BAAE|nr:uncharacterized protein N7518_006683 [Penicillium psychrosexuale]KAJ5789672.1 hypothetical protein N7518_006683 [Penicillium psychrosexuale]
MRNNASDQAHLPEVIFLASSHRCGLKPLNKVFDLPSDLKCNGRQFVRELMQLLRGGGVLALTSSGRQPAATLVQCRDDWFRCLPQSDVSAAFAHQLLCSGYHIRNNVRNGRYVRLNSLQVVLGSDTGHQSLDLLDHAIGLVLDIELGSSVSKSFVERHLALDLCAQSSRPIHRDRGIFHVLQNMANCYNDHLDVLEHHMRFLETRNSQELVHRYLELSNMDIFDQPVGLHQLMLFGDKTCVGPRVGETTRGRAKMPQLRLDLGITMLPFVGICLESVHLMRELFFALPIRLTLG